MAEAESDQLESRPSAGLAGELVVPGDKSISHRALILGALADGETRVEGLLESADVLHTAAAARALGAAVERAGEGRWLVRGEGRLREPAGPIDCGNSGTAARLLMGAVAGFPVRATFTGDASLSRRPMRRVTRPLAAMGARVEGGETLPLTIKGGELGSIRYVAPVPSAQVKSAILLAGLRAEGAVELVELVRTRDHSERMLRAAGVEVDEEDGAEGRRIALGAERRVRARSIRVPGDPSSAAFLVAAALVCPGSRLRVPGVLMNPLRTGLFTTLAEMGAALSVEPDAAADGGEPVGALDARAGALKGVVVPPERAPAMIDEYPVLAALAAFAEGDTVMAGVKELRVKESDRIALMAAGLRACGVEVSETRDTLVVHGRGRPPRGGALVETGGDHRIAMSFLILGLGAREPVRVTQAGMIGTSFPGFAALLAGAGAEIARA